MGDGVCCVISQENEGWRMKTENDKSLKRRMLHAIFSYFLFSLFLPSQFFSNSVYTFPRSLCNVKGCKVSSHSFSWHIYSSANSFNVVNILYFLFLFIEKCVYPVCRPHEFPLNIVTISLSSLHSYIIAI